MLSICATIVALVLLANRPGHCDQQYDYRYIGANLVQITAELLDGDRTISTFDTLTLETWHYMQVTCNQSSGYYDANGAFGLKFPNGQSGPGDVWSVRVDYGDSQTLFRSVSAQYEVDVGNYQATAWTTNDKDTFFEVDDDHTIHVVL